MNAEVFSSTTRSPFSSSPWALRDSRRGSSRREIVLPCQAVRERDFKLIADRTLDISADGVLLPLRIPVLTGESLIVSFGIPGVWIDAEATVARVIHGRRPGDDGLAIGVMFDRLSPSARAALTGYLHGRRSPLPRRGPLARLRRGEAPPRLADDSSFMLDVLVSPSLVCSAHETTSRRSVSLAEATVIEDVGVSSSAIEFLNDDDFEECTDDDDELSSLTKEEAARYSEAVGLDILRALVGAWQSLGTPSDRANLQ
jgi:hypothetical protein